MWCFVCQIAVFCINAQRTPVVGMSKLGEPPGSGTIVVRLFRGACGKETLAWQQPSPCSLDGVARHGLQGLRYHRDHRDSLPPKGNRNGDSAGLGHKCFCSFAVWF